MSIQTVDDLDDLTKKQVSFMREHHYLGVYGCNGDQDVIIATIDNKGMACVLKMPGWLFCDVMIQCGYEIV